jgi:mannose-6-phosphate isomerase-like protein (cupin superfamily)
MENKTCYKLIKLNPLQTQGKPGTLTEVNLNKISLENDIEFNIYKCFYVNELNSTQSRGNHSNKNASEILVCLQGSFEIKLHDGTSEVILQIKQNEAIYINKNIWISYYNFSNCVIMAFVSIYVSDKESCYDFNEFLSAHNNTAV